MLMTVFAGVPTKVITETTKESILRRMCVCALQDFFRVLMVDEIRRLGTDAADGRKEH